MTRRIYFIRTKNKKAPDIIQSFTSPSSHVTQFTATTISASLIRVAWVSSVGAILPENYLLVARTAAGSFPSVQNGTPVSDDTNWANGNNAINIAYQFGSMSYDFEGLDPNVQYFFEIYPYTGSGSSIGYKTDGTVPSANATTWNNQTTLPNKLFEFDGTAYTETGGEVDQWTDLSSEGNNAVDVAARNTPNVASAYINGVDSIEFNATNNEILRIPAITGITNLSLYILFEPDLTNSTRKLIGNQSAQTGFIVLIDTNRIQVTMRDGVGSQIQQILNFTVAAFPGPVLLVIRMQSNGAGTSVMNVSLNGVEMISRSDLNSMSPSTADIDIGSDASNLSYDGHIHKIIAYSVFHNDEQTAQNIASINSQYATTFINSLFVKRAIMTSSIDAAVTNLYGVFYADKGFVNMPVLVVYHSWNGNATDFTDVTIQRLGASGMFVVVVGDRGRNGAGGARDASMRELYDYYDIVKYVVSNYSDRIDVARFIADSYSGGGGNVHGMRVKFPYMFTKTVAHFGISNYENWYNQEPSRQTQISTSIGDTPINVPDAYEARNHIPDSTEAFAPLQMYHDVDDADVEVSHSDNVRDQHITDGNTNYAYTRTDSGSATRATHGLPNIGDPGATNIAFESEWMPDCFTLPVPSLPTSGDNAVRGFVVIATPNEYLFDFWIGDNTNPKSSGSTNNQYGRLEWNYAGNEYTFTPGTTDTVHYQFVDVLGRVASGSTSAGTPVTFNPS